MTPGIYDAIITGNGIASTPSGSAFAAIHCECEGEAVTAKIFLTEKSAGMARKGLSVCGFDIDKTHLSELGKVPGLLAGNKVKLSFEEHATYGLQANIFLGELTEKKVDALTKALRSAKSDKPAKKEKSATKVVAEAHGDDMPPLPEGDDIPF